MASAAAPPTIRRITREEIGRHLTPEDLATREGVPIKTVYEWNHKGTGPRYMKIGKHVRYKLADVEAWENAQYADGGGTAA